MMEASTGQQGDGGGGRGNAGRGGVKGNKSRGGRGGRGGRGKKNNKTNDKKEDSNKDTANKDNTTSNKSDANTKANKKGGDVTNTKGGAEANKNNNRNRRRNNQNKNTKKGGDKQPKDPVTPKITKEEQERLEKEKQRKIEEEAERKRLEEEEKALQALREIRQKAEKELNDRYLEAMDYLKSVAETTESRVANRNAMSTEYIVASRKEFESSKKSLKSDLKKCTAFVKKIKTGGAWSMTPDALVKDASSLNLSRYVEEVVAAVLEGKLKLTDLSVVLVLCKTMNLRYPTFLPALMAGLWSVVHSKPTDAENSKLRRVYVRILTELLLNGLSTETKPFMKLIAEASGGKDGSYNVTDASIVVAFVKAAGFEILGTNPTSVQKYSKLIEGEILRKEQQENNCTDEEDSNLPVLISDKKAAGGKNMLANVDQLLMERAISSEISNKFLGHCIGAYGFLAKSLVNTDTKLQKMEKRCEQDRLVAGSLTEAREKGLQDARKLRESLEKSVEAMSDILDLPFPKLEKEAEEETEGGTGVEVWTKDGGDEMGTDYGPFDDEETRAFYCDVPDFLTTVPPALIGLSPEEIEKRKAVNQVKFGSAFGDDNDTDGDVMTAEVAASSEAELEAAEQEEHKESGDDNEESKEENKDTPHYKLMVLLEQELPECSRREQIDEISEKFCTNHGSSKNARKRLSQTLFHVPRARLDLLPYYSRMAATLGRVWPDIGDALLIDLEQQFHGQAKFKKNQNIESRMRTARYIGELTIFRMAPPIVALRCLRRCMDDFTGGNVDVACCLLESCGRYLYRLPHTNKKLSNIMEIMIRLSKAKVRNALDMIFRSSILKIFLNPVYCLLAFGRTRISVD
jgi:regulator of nonsense transcripts 2